MNPHFLRASALLLALAVPASAQLLFGPPATTDYSRFAAAPRVAAGDVDGDGFADLVYGNAGAPGLRLGDGAGLFGPESPIATSASGSSVALADLNGDRVLDLLVGTSLTGTLHVTMGAGDGSFGAPVSYTLGIVGTGQNQLNLHTADADGDGDSDVLAVTSGSATGSTGEARLFRNLGTGTLGLVGVEQGSLAFLGPKVIGGFPADLNGDSLPDMVVVYNAGIMLPSLSAKALLCQSDATFVALWASASVIPGRAADLDGDGDQDLLTVALVPPFGPPASSLIAQLNAGDGSFIAGPETVVPAPNGVIGSGLQDLDGDGLPDLTLVGQFPAELWVLRGIGDGSFQMPGVHVTLSNTATAGAGQLADFDGDGRLDVTCAVGSSTTAPFQAVSLNRTYPDPGPLLDVGHQLKGASWPIQIASGSFLAGQPFSFKLSGAPSGGAAFFIVGLSQLDAPFKGGTMVPLPFFIVGPLPASPSGDVNLAGLWPAGPSGIQLLFQFWIPDAAGPVGFASSSGVRLIVP